MEWTRSESLPLAAMSCTQCHGLGLKTIQHGRKGPCNCVFRSIFRVCFSRFRHCATKEKHLSRASLEISPHGGRRITWGRKDEEYIADFLLVTKRTLEPEEYQVFSWHFLLGADWRLCCRRLKVDKGDFFHTVYRIQQKLGKTFRDLKPYPLFPLDDYFHNSLHQEARPDPDPTPAARSNPRVVSWRPKTRIPEPERRAA